MHGIDSSRAGDLVQNVSMRFTLGCLGVLVVLVGPASPLAQAPRVSPVRGTVADADGKPVNHAAAALLTAAGAIPADVRLQAVTPVSGPTAEFVITNVPHGSYKLVVATVDALKNWPSPEVVARHAGRAFPLEVSSDLTLRMIVEVGPEPARSLTPSRMSSSQLELVGGPGGDPGAPPPGAPPRPGGISAPLMRPTMNGPGAISGVVTGPDGQPVVGVQVQIGRWQSTAKATSRLLAMGLPVETDENGRYRVTGLQPAAYVVAAMAWRFDINTITESSRRNVPAVTDQNGRRMALQTTYYPNTTRAVTARDVPVGDDEVRDINLTMQRAPVATFTARFGEAQSTVRGFMPARLAPMSTPDQFAGRNVIQVTPDANGLFTFRDVPLGQQWIIYYTSSGWVKEMVAVTPELEARTEPLVFALQPPLTINGRIDFKPTRITATPDALSGLTVALNLAPMGPGPVLRSPVAADGSFTITGIPGDQYVLTLMTGSPWIVVSSMLGDTDSLDTPVTIRSNIDDARLLITDRQTNIQGRVTAADGSTVSGGSVVIFATDQKYWTVGATRRVRVLRINPGGTYNADGFPPGSYHVAAFRAGTRINNTLLGTVAADAPTIDLALGETKVVPLILR